eukprot:6120363-Karenia_brevis.AAC.1
MEMRMYRLQEELWIESRVHCESEWFCLPVGISRAGALLKTRVVWLILPVCMLGASEREA